MAGGAPPPSGLVGIIESRRRRHAAVVASEMGVPAVFGVPGTTTLLGAGETVTVDGIRGSINRSPA